MSIPTKPLNSASDAPPATDLPVRTVTCPTCGGDSRYAADNPFRPFCSNRCKQIDLGAWDSEDFRVPTDNPPEDEAFGDPRLQH
jgi:endogenous inhibitor of DNA gyrase (YacG/DUF329 family)